jgi:hypothetical protein
MQLTEWFGSQPPHFCYADASFAELVQRRRDLLLALRRTILQALPAAQPFKVVYSASDGESFNATGQNNSFSAMLPNMMDYQVRVHGQYSDGTIDYYANNLTVVEGIGVPGWTLS